MRVIDSTHHSPSDSKMPSMDQKRKELIQQKEELLRQSRMKSSTLDSVKTQIELLVKVTFFQGSYFCQLTLFH